MDLRNFATIAEAFEANASRFPNREVYRTSRGRIARSILAVMQFLLGWNPPWMWRVTTYQEMHQRVYAIAAFIQAQPDFEPGFRVGVVSLTRWEWLETALAINLAGGTLVPMMPDLEIPIQAYIMEDAEVQLVFAENQQQCDRLAHLFSYAINVAGHEDADPKTVCLPAVPIVAFEHVETSGLRVIPFSEVALSGDGLNRQFIQAREHPAVLLYTSGTTGGAPKGVVQMDAAYLTNAAEAAESPIIAGDTSIFFVLPLAHAMGLLFGLGATMIPELTLRFARIADRTKSVIDKELIRADLAAAQADICPMTPLTLERIRERIQGKAQTGLLANLIGRTLDAARAARAGTASEEQQAWYDKSGILRKLIVEKVFGPNLRYVLCGAAVLGEELAEWFEALGVPVLNGWGLSELCVAGTITDPNDRRHGTVGKPLHSDIEIGFYPSELGDNVQFVKVRRPGMPTKYHQRPTATTETWVDGWVHTGDVGYLDDAGNLVIPGRAKDVYVLKNGENIPPDGIEATVKVSPYIRHAVLVGHGREQLGVFVTLNGEAIQAWAKEQNWTLTDPMEKDSEVTRLIQAEVARVNEDRPKTSKIGPIHIWDLEPSVENGLLTPSTLKFRRLQFLEKYAEEVDGLYTSAAQG